MTHPRATAEEPEPPQAQGRSSYDAVLAEIRDEVVATRIKGESTAAKADELIADLAELARRLDGAVHPRRAEVGADVAATPVAETQSGESLLTPLTLLGAALLLLSWAVALCLSGGGAPAALVVLVAANVAACAAILADRSRRLRAAGRS